MFFLFNEGRNFFFYLNINKYKLKILLYIKIKISRKLLGKCIGNGICIVLMKIKLYLRIYFLYFIVIFKLRYSYDNFIIIKLNVWMLFNCVKIDLNVKFYDSKSF